MADTKTTMDELNDLINNFDEHYYKKQIQKYGHRVSWILPQSYDDSLTFLEMLQSLLYTLNAEIKRAIQAEQILGVDLDKEIDRAKKAEQALREALDAEIARAKDAENTLTNNLNAEIARAKDAENTLTNNLNSEIARAKDAEKTLTNNLNAEIQRATQAEKALTDSLNAEIERAKQAEKTNADAITAETNARIENETHIVKFRGFDHLPNIWHVGELYTITVTNVATIPEGTSIVGYSTGKVKYNDVDLPVLEWSWSNNENKVTVNAIVKLNQDEVEGVESLDIFGQFTYKKA